MPLLFSRCRASARPRAGFKETFSASLPAPVRSPGPSSCSCFSSRSPLGASSSSSSGSFAAWAARRIDFSTCFAGSSKFSEVQSVCRSLAHSPLVGVFLAGYVELNDQLRQNGPPEGRPGSAAPRPNLRSFDALDRALLRASTVEVNKLERHVPFLATTAAITPFIGLFGTVWGIMSAFQGIGEDGLHQPRCRGPGHC